jgi:hypothetical protein
MATVGMWGGEIAFFEPEDGTELYRHLVTVPIGNSSRGSIDAHGDIWIAREGDNIGAGDGVFRMPFTGLDGAGKPTYGPPQALGIPAP